MTDIDFTAEHPPTLPPRHTGTVCGHMVSGGMMSYRCSLIQGHGAKPPEDPEPHYAVEVQRSVKAWADWARRQWEEGRSRQAEQEAIVVEEAHGDLPVATAKGAEQPPPFQCMLKDCDYPFPHSHGTDKMGQTETVYGPPEVEGQRPQVLIDNAQDIANGQLHNPYDAACERREFAAVSLPHERCLVCRPYDAVPSSKVIFDLLTMVKDEYPAPGPSYGEIESWDDDTKRAVADWAAAVHLVASDNNDVEIPSMPSVLNAFDGVPPKQRPEDQPLPDGDIEIVDDQQVLIDFITERREIGIQRYGQGHRPFNGRNTLQDLYEEQVDLMVYFTSVMRSAMATREDLLAVVEKAMASFSQTAGPEEMTNARVAEVAVDRVMSWVAATILMAPEIHWDQIQQAVLAEFENEHKTQGDFAVSVADRLTGRTDPEPQPGPPVGEAVMDGQEQ